MEEPVIETTNPRTSVIPASRFERFMFAFIITFLPGLAFWGIEQMRPEWQTRRTEDYVALLLSPEASFFFFPLLAYGILAYWLLLLGEQRFVEKFWVRFGVYTGILLAGQYVILAAIMMPFSILIGLGIIALYWIAKKIAKKLGKYYAIGFILILAPLGMGIQSGFDLDFLFDLFLMLVRSLFFVLIGMGIGSPSLCLGIALPTGLRLWQKYDQPLMWTGSRSVGLASWLAGFAAAWAVSVYKMIETYNALPTQPPPDCYIATAAARGHTFIVGSQPVHRKTSTLMVNRQLQTLKCAELALQALAPRLHRTLRFLYDIIGPPLARRLTHPLLADLAYLSLKPAELMARFALRIIVPNLDEYASRLYR